MSIKPLFADPNHLHLERISSEPGLITIIVKTKSTQALCSQRHSLSAHLHSRYVRRLADLPWFGIAVRVEVQAQRLYCRHFGADPYPETPEESFFSFPFFFESFSFLSFFFDSPFLASGVVVWSALGALSVSPVICPAGWATVSA